MLCHTEQACDAAQKADVAAVVMQEGLANVVLVTPAMTLLRAKVEVTIPRKRKGSCTQHEKVGHAPPCTHSVTSDQISGSENTRNKFGLFLV